MWKRILIVAMLIITMLTQYVGAPSCGFTHTKASAFYSETPVFNEPITPNPNEASPTPSVTPEPSDNPTPTPGPGGEISPSEPPSATSAASETPPVISPPPEATSGSSVVAPEITPSPTPVLEPTPAPLPPLTPTPAAAPAPAPAPPSGPLFLDLPAQDTMSINYINFRKDMTDVIKKALKQSGMKTTYGVFIMDLKSELHFGVNESLTRIDPYDNQKEGYFNSASVIKLFQGYILCDMMRRGELDPSKTYVDSVTGRKFRLIPMLKAMISYSDNNYSNATLRLVGNKKCNEVLDRLGIHDSRIYGEMSGAVGYSSQNNLKRYGTVKRCARLTPRDAGLILYNVYRHKDSDTYMKAMNEGLLGNIYNTRIPVGVRRVSSKYRIAHKTGTNSDLGVYNDAGIIYCKNPYILVVFTQAASSMAGHAFIRSLAEQLTGYFDARAEKRP